MSQLEHQKRDRPVIEVTPSMEIEGACVLEAWMAQRPEDTDLFGLSSLEASRAIFLRMQNCRHRQQGC